VVDAAVDDPLAENFRDDLANPLRADALLAGNLVIRPALSEPRENALPPRGLAQNVEPPPGCWSLVHGSCLASLEKRNYSIAFGK
jgi:hypothetical protein